MSKISPLDYTCLPKRSIESPSLNYTNSSPARKVAFAVDIPYPVLKCWYNFMSSSTRKERKDSSACAEIEDDQQFERASANITYCDLLESTIPGNVFAISSKEQIRHEIHESLRKRSADIKKLYRRTKGAKRIELDVKR